MAEKAISPLRRRMIEDMRIRGIGQETQRDYIRAVKKLNGRIEMEDAYLGGARSGGKRGRGAAGKTPFIAAVETTIERRPRRIKLKTVKGFRKKEVERFPYSPLNFIVLNWSIKIA